MTSRKFSVRKVLACCSLYPDDIFTAEVNGEPVVALGSYFVETLVETDIVENVRKAS